MRRGKRSARQRSAVQAIPFTAHPDHETIWAIAAGPPGLVHVAVCCESSGGGTVYLYAYDVRSGKMRMELDVARALKEDPANGHATHGKVHFALCPARDGWIYAATHCTTPPRGDATWSALGMWSDPVKSFSGAHLFRFRADNSAFEDFGIPYPHQGISTMALDDERGILVGSTYPGADLFTVRTDGTDFRDMGRVSEDYPLSLLTDGQGLAWSSDSYGYLLRIDLERPAFELLNARTPRPSNPSVQFNCMCDAVLGPDGFIYGISYSSTHLFRFQPAREGAVRVEDLGPIIESPGCRLPRGLAFANDGKLYASLYDANDKSAHIDLVRYDPLRKRGQWLAKSEANGAPKRFWRATLGEDGKIYAGECGRKPVSMVIIDPTVFP